MTRTEEEQKGEGKTTTIYVWRAYGLRAIMRVQGGGGVVMKGLNALFLAYNNKLSLLLGKNNS